MSSPVSKIEIEKTGKMAQWVKVLVPRLMTWVQSLILMIEGGTPKSAHWLTNVKIQLLKKVFFGPISLKKDLWSFSSSYDALWLMVVSVFVKPNVQWASEITSWVHRCLPLCLTTKFHLQDPRGKKRELTPESYFLISTSVVWHMHHFPQKRININVIEIIKTIKSKMGAG